MVHTVHKGKWFSRSQLAAEYRHESVKTVLAAS